MRPRSLTLLLSAALLAPLGIGATRAEAGRAAADDPAGRIASTIASMRGLTLSGLSTTARKALFKRLDEKWDILMRDPETTRRVAREVLAKEEKDGFLIIELSRLLLVLERGITTPAETTAWLVRADPNLYPPAYFDLVSEMAARHCQECLPAALRMLDLRRLDAYMPAHALPIDLELGLIFTIGQYGDAAIPEVLARLDSKECDVRGNAALILGYLQPQAAPPAIRTMALADGCPSARTKAWDSLGMLADPGLAALVEKRLAAKPAPKTEEKVAMVHALSATNGPAAKRVLRSFQSDPDTDVARLAAAARQMAKGPRSSGEEEGTAPSSRRKATALLEKAIRREKADPEIDPAGLAAVLLPEDLPLLNKARAAVLGRLSDECLSEYFVLTRAAHDLRARGGSDGGAAPRPR